MTVRINEKITETWGKLRLVVGNQLNLYHQPLWWQQGRSYFLPSAFVLLVMILYLASGAPFAYSVEVDGTPVGLVTSTAVVQEALVSLQDTLPREEHVNLASTVATRRVLANGKDFLGPEELEATLASKLEYNIKGVVVAINGNDTLYLEDEKTADSLLAAVKNRFKPEGENSRLKALDLEERWEVHSETFQLSLLVDEEEALNQLLVGRSSASDYEVRDGDNLWTIARRFNLSVADIVATNKLSSERLMPGDILRLAKMDPLVHIKTSWEIAKEEYIPYKVKYKSDNSLERGRDRVEKKGEEGRVVRTYLMTASNGQEIERKIVEEQVVKKPVDKVVRRGTSAMLASRSGGSGRLAWPIRGVITSYFGARGGGYHTAIDIDGSTGDRVYAAEDGKITFVGRAGNYGLQVAINHGGGLVTRYNHLSAATVSVGDVVKRGEMIGRVGISGRTTGSHLDFEVIDNGGFKNPLNYLR